MALLFAFLLCWTPYAIVYLWPILNEKRIGSVTITALGPLFAKLSTVLTPLILLYYTDNLATSPTPVAAATTSSSTSSRKTE
jgi:hypothetical protein